MFVMFNDRNLRLKWIYSIVLAFKITTTFSLHFQHSTIQAKVHAGRLLNKQENSTGTPVRSGLC